MVTRHDGHAKKVLFVCYGGGHATMVAPVVKALNAQWPGIETVVLGLTNSRMTFEAEGIPYLGFADFIDPDTDADALAWGERLLENNFSQHAGVSREESVAYLGLNYVDLISEHGLETAAVMYEQQGRKQFMPLPTMRRILEKVSPELVVTTTSARAELAARRVAREMGLLNLVLTDVLGLGGFTHEMIVDHLCVANRMAEENYRQTDNVRAGHIHLVGNPAMDRMVRQNDAPVDLDWRKENFPAESSRKFVLVAEQYGYLRSDGEVFVAFSAAEVVANLDRIYACCQTNDAVMLVRPHPSLSPQIYEDWIGGRSDAFLAQSHDLAKLLNISDLVVSNFSTIMLDALYANRPVLLVNYPDSCSLMPFDELGYATGVMIEDEVELAEGMRRALLDEAMVAAQFRTFKDDFAELPCAHKIADIISNAIS